MHNLHMHVGVVLVVLDREDSRKNRVRGKVVCFEPGMSKLQEPKPKKPH